MDLAQYIQNRFETLYPGEFVTAMFNDENETWTVRTGAMEWTAAIGSDDNSLTFVCTDGQTVEIELED